MGIHQMLMGAGGKAPGSWIGDRGIFGGSGAGYPTTQYINIPTTGIVRKEDIKQTELF